MKYYWLSFDESVGHTVAYAPKGNTQPADLISIIEDQGLKNLPFSFQLYSIGINAGGLQVGEISDKHLDSQPNNLALPLMSQRLKDVIVSSLNGNEPIRWVSAKVLGKTAVFPYYVPLFTEKMDVLDDEKSIFVGPWRTLLKPYYKQSKIDCYAFFNGDPNNWLLSRRLYVNESIKCKIQQLNLSGVQLIEARTT